MLISVVHLEPVNRVKRMFLLAWSCMHIDSSKYVGTSVIYIIIVYGIYLLCIITFTFNIPNVKERRLSIAIKYLVQLLN